jgi:hypothetical protein
MANTSTASPTPAVIEEAIRITAESQRRATENAQAAVQATRRYFDQGAQLNKDLWALWTATFEAGLQTTFDVQNAALTVGEDTAKRWADLTRQAQATATRTHQANAKYVSGLITEV